MAYSRPQPLRREHELSGFASGEASLDVWLAEYARRADADGSARVFVTTAGDRRVVGFYALANGSVSPAEATERLLAGQPRRRAVPVVLVARLAVDRAHQGRGLGASLLQDALLRIAGVAGEVGVRVVLVHAIGEQARSWYERFGFESSPTDPLQLILLMKDLRKLIDEFESS